MYVIETEFENCNYDSFQNIKEEMYGKVIIQVKSSNNFPTLQSKVQKKQLLLDVLSNEVSKFKWLICSHINLELHWYFNGYDKMTTDSIGDLDNLMKPIIDSLTGSNGLFVDDSQIKSLYNEWNSINKNIYENIVTIFIDFSNDYCYEKINLKFIEIKNNLYIPYNFNLNFLNKESILTLIMVITSFNFSTKLYQLVSIDMPTSFHRSRLNQILQNNIYNKDKIKNLINTFYNDKNEIKNNLLRLESIQNLNIKPKYIKLINDFLNNYFD